MKSRSLVYMARIDAEIRVWVDHKLYGWSSNSQRERLEPSAIGRAGQRKFLERRDAVPKGDRTDVIFFGGSVGRIAWADATAGVELPT